MSIAQNAHDAQAQGGTQFLQFPMALYQTLQERQEPFIIHGLCQYVYRWTVNWHNDPEVILSPDEFLHGRKTPGGERYDRGLPIKDARTFYKFMGHAVDCGYIVERPIPGRPKHRAYHIPAVWAKPAPQAKKSASHAENADDAGDAPEQNLHGVQGNLHPMQKKFASHASASAPHADFASQDGRHETRQEAPTSDKRPAPYKYSYRDHKDNSIDTLSARTDAHGDGRESENAVVVEEELEDDPYRPIPERERKLKILLDSDYQLLADPTTKSGTKVLARKRIDDAEPRYQRMRQNHILAWRDEQAAIAAALSSEQSPQAGEQQEWPEADEQAQEQSDDIPTQSEPPAITTSERPAVTVTDEQAPPASERQEWPEAAAQQLDQADEPPLEQPAIQTDGQTIDRPDDGLPGQNPPDEPRTIYQPAQPNRIGWRARRTPQTQSERDAQISHAKRWASAVMDAAQTGRRAELPV